MDFLRFSQFYRLKSTLILLINSNIIIKFDALTCFEWLNIEIQEMELIKFQESIIWRNEFINSLIIWNVFN